VILVDAGPMVALVRRPDQHHEECVDALRRIEGPLGTVWPAVTEAMFLLADRPDAQGALAKSLESEAIAVLPLGRQDVPRIRELMWKYRDRPMDFTDAALVRVAEREGIDTIFTVDRKDFAIYRLHGRRRFTVIP
jgi:predicted nucleic acid-binding protein